MTRGSTSARWMAWTIALAVATALLAYTARQVQWQDAWTHLQRTSPAWLLVAVVCNGSILIFWTVQWKLLLPKAQPVALRRVGEVVSLMAMVANTVPYLMGQASGVLLLARRGRVGHAVALSVLALEQILEGLAKLSLLLLVALNIPLPYWVKKGVLALVIAVLALGVVSLVFAHMHRDIEEISHDSSLPWHARVKHFAQRWGHHLEALRRPRIFVAGYGLAVTMKLAELAAILAVQQAIGVDLPVWSAGLVLASTSVVTMVAIAPGNIGVYEATAFLAYQYLNVQPEQALSLALLQHVCYLVPMVGTGYLVLLIQNVKSRTHSRASGNTRSTGEAGAKETH